MAIVPERGVRPIMYGNVAASSLVPTGTRKNKLWCLHVLHFEVRPLGTSDGPRSLFQVAPAKIECQLCPEQGVATSYPVWKCCSIIFGTHRDKEEQTLVSPCLTFSGAAVGDI